MIDIVREYNGTSQLLANASTEPDETFYQYALAGLTTELEQHGRAAAGSTENNSNAESNA